MIDSHGIDVVVVVALVVVTALLLSHILLLLVASRDCGRVVAVAVERLMGLSQNQEETNDEKHDHEMMLSLLMSVVM